MDRNQKILRGWIKQNFKLPTNMNTTRRVQDMDLVRFFERSNPKIVINVDEIRESFRDAGFRVYESLDLGFVVNIRRTDYRAAIRGFLR